MQILNTFRIAIITSLFTMGCGNPANTDSGGSDTGHQHQPAETGNIQLNHGEKWKVNDEMKPFIQESEAILNNFLKSGREDYVFLAKQLEGQNTLLIKSCTMEGASHEELHKWLHPHMELIRALEHEKDSEKAQALIQEIKKSLDTYHQYFQ